jgi:NADPH-dependent 2,4-dienoyl-CoA reductase/sulfur reductase-like enzyme/rhodanese-related sulfurtransferase
MSKAIKVVIVGGVAGGATAAARIRRLNELASIKIFEKGEYVSYANCGLPYYIGNIITDHDDLLLASPELFRGRFNISVSTKHEVTEIKRNEKIVLVKNLEKGTVFQEEYDYLVLATGAYPVKPDIPGVNSEGIFTLRSIGDSDTIKAYIDKSNVKKVAIVGGGFIGLEMAESLVHRGITVEIIERSPQVMAPFDPEMVQDVHKELKQKGVTIHFRTAVNAFEKLANGTFVVKADEGKQFNADMVILAIGVRPDIAMIKAAGIELGSLGGIKTNDRMQTSDPSIYAVGDSVETKDFITGRNVIIPLANPANRQGRVAADNIANPNTSIRYRGVQGTAICKVFDYTIGITGCSEKTLKRFEVPYEKVYLHPFHHVSYYPGAHKIALKVLFEPKTGRILGAQACGMDGVDKRIDVISMAIQSGKTMNDLEEVELCYSPQYGSAKDPINLAGMIASNMLRGDQPITHWTSTEKREQLIDVRSEEEHKTFHVPNSKNIPLPELRQRLGEIRKDLPVFVYCAVGQRGYYATRLLRLHGYDARNISGGVTTYKSTMNV